MHLYNTSQGQLLIKDGIAFLFTESWDSLINQPKLYKHLEKLSGNAQPIFPEQSLKLQTNPLAPIGNQEVWAAGVTYLRSRDARMEESKSSGAADVYQKVYEADRPELFFNSASRRGTTLT